MGQSEDLMQGFRRLSGELDQLFVDIIGGPRVPGSASVRALADVYITDDPPVLTVQLDLAGVDPAQVDVTLEGDLLVVRGERHRPRGERRLYQHAEIDWGPFERRVRLGVRVDPDAVRASYDRGLLTIALPLAPPGPQTSVSISAPADG